MRLVEGKVVPVGKHQMLLAGGQRPEQRVEGNIGPPQGHRDAQIEPVAVIGPFGADVDLRCFGQLGVIGRLPDNVHPHMFQTGQFRQGCGGEPRGVQTGQGQFAAGRGQSRDRVRQLLQPRGGEG
ncbi:hypothetical protein [Arthrobacter terrae]|uniref:hypothetical protein n=1 Tax=Arthrobacter terrae TaxID=2935737 RepID=UPI001E517E18|nr:hypothetical protein [Arthrobacter terrae]